MSGVAVDLQRLAQDVVDGLPRVERGVGVLEHELQHPPVRAAAAPRRGPAIDLEPRALRRHEPGDRPEDRRFARTGLPDDAEGLAGRDLERDPFDRADQPAADAKRHVEVLDRDHASHAGSRTTVASSGRGTSSDGVAATSARV